jgi:hypothetical protein
MLEAQHGVNEIPIGYPGEENIILFNNNSRVGEGADTSEVIEFRPPDDYYIEDGEAWGPTEPVWVFRDNFYAPKQSGAFRLPNGNTFVSVAGGDMFEVTYEKEIVWEYFTDGIFRAQKYGLDYLILLGDVNHDGVINVLDVVLVVGYVLDMSYIIEGDTNEDGILNILDIVTIITFILGV